MQRLIALLSVFLLTACGSETPTDTGDLDPGADPAAVVIDQPPGDSVRPVEVFPDSMGASVSSEGGEAVSGALVSFETSPDGCATSVASALQTNSNGRVFFHVTSGTEAVTSTGSPCTIMAVQSEAGRASVADSVQATILPGEIVSVTATGCAIGTNRRQLNRVVTDNSASPLYADAHGNPGTWTVSDLTYAHRAGSDVLDHDSRTLVADSVGTEAIDIVGVDPETGQDTLIETATLDVSKSGTDDLRIEVCW